MNSTSNVFLQTAATALVAWGVELVKSNLWHGVLVVALGVVVYAVYELVPSK